MSFKEGPHLKTGIIGTGNMGTILVESFIESKALVPSDVYIHNRTPEKSLKLKSQYPGLNVAANNREVIEKSDIIFLCVKPKEIYSLIAEHQSVFLKEKCVVSITSPITTAQLESLLPCSCIRAIPSITNRALAGAVLVTFGENCQEEWKNQFLHLIKAISHPVEIDDRWTRAASDIVSCGPAFFSYMTRKFIQAAVNETGISQKTAENLASEMLIGMGELLKKKIYTLQSLEEKVCVKGGITGEGIAILEQEIGDMFEKLFAKTHAKFAEDIAEINQQFGA